jgi:alpha-1,3-rhamnosyl/mannosyltransferase
MVSNTGIGRWLQNMVRHVMAISSGHEITVLVNRARGVRSFGIPVRELASDIPIYSIREQIILPLEIRKQRPDLVHYPNFNVPLMSSTASVVTLCDIIYYLFPKACPSRIGHEYARHMIATATRRAKKIVTISEHSKRDLVDHLKIAEDKVAVIYPGIDREAFRPDQPPEAIDTAKKKHGIERPYIFYTGNHEPRKNLRRLVEAYRRFSLKSDFQLVLGGRIDPRRQDFYREISDLVEARNVILAGEISESDLPLLYAGAQAFVFPSTYEGFGLPPLEAMSAGVPVACSSATSLPEVVGDAAILFAPESTDEMLSAMERILTDRSLAAELRRKGLEQANRFSWPAAAQQLIQVYEGAVRA